MIDLRFVPGFPPGRRRLLLGSAELRRLRTMRWLRSTTSFIWETARVSQSRMGRGASGVIHISDQIVLGQPWSHGKMPTIGSAGGQGAYMEYLAHKEPCTPNCLTTMWPKSLKY